MPRVALLLLLSLLSLSAAAQTTPVLVPVFYNGPGAFGSQWFTSVRLNNFTTQTVEGHGLLFIVQCPIPEGCFADALLPNAVGSVGGPMLSTGFLLHIPAAETDRFEIDARFGEFTRNRYGVELPIAREDDFRRTPIVLPYVVMLGGNNDVRTSLRIFSPDAIADQQVRVELRPPGSRGTETPQASQVVTLALSDPPGTARPLRPAFAQLELQRSFQIFAGFISIRIVPLPRADGSLPRIWAMASTVRNDTNEVSVYSPQ